MKPQKFVDMAVHRPEMVWSVGLFESADARRRGYELGALGYNAILLAIGDTVSYVAAGIAFQRRDLPAP